MSILISQQEKQPKRTKRKRSRAIWISSILVVLSIIGLSVLVFLIVSVQGLDKGLTTLTIISLVLGMVLSLLSLLVNIFQWREAAATNTMIDAGSELEQSVEQDAQSLHFTSTVVTGQLVNGPLPPAGLLPLAAQDGNPPSIDWGEAPAVEHFYGRKEELTTLKHWVQGERCRMVVIHAMGGMGKTTLSKELTQQVSADFDFVFWRSLQNVPPLDQVLETCVAFLSKQQTVLLPDHLDAKIVVLIDYLRRQRCLLVLDNFESVLQGGDQMGVYLDGYEGYGRLLELVGAGKHQSCLLLTTRERPRELVLLGDNSPAIRTLELNGLDLNETQSMLSHSGLSGSDALWTRFIDLYSKNPLALKLASASIREVFQGDIATFLDQGEHVSGEVSSLVERQFERASPVEQEILSWLAVERERASLDVLNDDMAHSLRRGELQQALYSLRRRSLVENAGTGLFLLQPVILEYVTTRLVTRICQELLYEKIELLQSHALIKAQAPDYVRASQKRLLLGPIASYLRSTLGQEASEYKLKHLLATLQKTAAHRPGYAAGNILNILIALGTNLGGYDFSHLVIKQAYLQGVQLADVNFAHADLETSAFTQTFGNILALAMDAQGHFLAAGTANGKVELCRMPDCTPFQTLEVAGLEEWVRSIAFSPGGDLLASGNDDETVRLWHVQSGRELILPHAHSGRVYTVAFRSRDDLLASAGDDHMIHIWNVRSQQHIQTLQGEQGRVRSISFSPGGDLLASGSEDNSIAIWNMNTGKCIHTLREHNDHVYAIAFSPDGQRLVSGSDDSTVRLWDVESGNCIHVLQGHSDRVQSVAYSPDGRLLASGGMDQTVRIWESEGGRCIHALHEHTNRIRAVTFSPDSALVVSGGDDQTVRLWEVESGQCLRTLSGHSSWVYAVAFSPDGQTVVSDNNDFALHEWDTDTGKARRILPDHTNWINTLAFSPDGRLIASGSDDKEIHLWDIKRGICIKQLQAGERVRSVTFSPNGKLLASGSDAEDVLLWDSTSGRRLAALQGHQDRVRAVAFAKNSEGDGGEMVLASAGEDEKVRIWQIGQGAQATKLVHTLIGHTGRIWSLAFSPCDNNLLASGGDDSMIRLWNVQAETPIGTLQVHTGRIYFLAFSPNGELLASASEDHTVRLWDVENRQCIAVFEGHSARIRSVAFNNTGTLLASGSHDGTVRLWDVESHQCLHTLRTDRPYERMNITGVKGITSAQKNILRDLGAIEL